MQIKATHRDFIEHNRDAYWAANDRAQLALRADRRFLGLTKTRDLIAHEAALDAIGFVPSPRPLILGKNLGRTPPTQAFQEMCEDGLAIARKAAKGERVVTPVEAV